MILTKSPILFFIYLTFLTQVNSKKQCFFPESDVDPFNFEISPNQPNEVIIVDTVVEPPTAQIAISTIRTTNLPKTDLSSAFQLRKRNNGQFMVVMKPNFTLPPFPGHVNQSVITINVICNTVSYPLLTLTIRQPNIYVPTFYNTPYSMHIPHHTSPQQQIETSILAIDWDPVKKYSVTFSIISGNEGNVFEIGFSNATYFNRKFLPTTTKDGKAVPQRWSHSQLPPIVNLILLQPLQLSQYNLVVQASDNANPPSTATTSLVVYVDMANDLIPIFEKEHYFVNYTLNTKAGDVLMEGGVIVASFDANRIDSNETILYVLEETDVGDLLDLNPLTAAIHAKQDFLSDKVGGQMKVNIRSYSELNPNRYHTSQIVLNENIENVGAHFSPCNVEVSVKENAAVGTLLTRLNVLGTFSSLRLSDNGAVFKILDDGSIVVSDSTFLDREKVANLHLIAQIIHTKGSAEGLKGSPCQRAKINVTLIDENDNAPQFSLPSYYFALPNIPRNNSEIGTIRATDPDEGMNSELEYDFDQEPPSDWPFDLIYKEDGVALIFIQQKNQRQIIERKYTFQIKANDISDEPRIGRVNVTVDFDSKVDGNDEEDVDMPNHSLLSPIPTQTKPNPTHFSMFDEDAEMSSIDGDVTKVHKDQSIQLPMKRHFEVEKYVFDLHSAIDVAQFVGTIKVVDGHPNEIFEYDLEINTPNIFEINSGTGDIFVGRRLLQMEHDGIEFVFEATATLNHLKVAKSEIVVRMDGSKSIFMLQPRFEQAIYQIKLNENTRPGRVGMVRAHHRAEEVIDDKIIYSLLTDSNQASNFQIDGNSGEINSTLQFDFEKDKRFQFKVIACLLSKPGLCGETDVIISVMDLNDNAPVFNNSLYTITTPLDLSVGSEVGTVVAMDEDSGKNKLIGYSLILPQQDRHLFSIDNNTGTIYLEQSFKEIQNYRFEVEATDHGEPPLSSKATVVVELGGSNPTAPEFDEFRYDIHRQAPIPSGVVLVQVHATDPDPGPIGQVKYQFASPANDGVKKDLEKLSINEESGKISSIVQLTSLDGPIMQITVEAVDQSPVFKRKSQTVVVLHIVSNETDKLEFVPLPKIVFISSDKAPGSSIINVQARSTMSELIKYSLESDSRIKKYFEIEEDRLQLRSKLMPGEYILKLKASIRNDYLTASHQMKVVVMKDREKFPVFDKLAYQFHVPLNGEMPLKLPKVNCTLANSPIEYSMFPTVNFPQGLDIDKITGQLSVDETFVKNNHKKGFVFVVVRARNMDFPQFFSDAAITIKVDETMFPSLLYRFSIDENTAIGSVINTSIKVTQDPSSQDTVRYTIQPSDTFNIDDNGNLIVIKDIDLEQMKPESNGIINLIATAKMNDETTSTKVQIKINDVDEFGPEFVDHNIRFVIKDDMEVGTELGQVMMSDRDFSGLTTLVFKFLTNGQEVFVGIDKEGKVELIDLPATIESGVYDLPLIVSDSLNRSVQQVIQFERSSNHTTLQPVIYEMEPITWSIPGGSNFAGTKLLITMPIHENDPIDWSFNIVSGNEDRLFRLNRFNASTTELELTTNDVRQNVFEIQVNGTNKANDVESMLLNVTIDFTNALQQFLPQFNDKTVDPNINIPLDHPETVSIYSGAASVPSNPSIPILYTIAFNGTQKMFTVDQKGNVNIVIAVEDRKLGNYQVKITAICGTFKADKVINVIINESPTPTQQPQLDVTTTLPPFGRLEFTKPNFAFHAEDTIDTDDIIGKVDFSVTFFNRDDYKIIIVPKVFNQLFKVDMDTGALFVRKSPPNGWKVREIVFQMFIVKNGENVRDAPSTRVNIVIDSSVSSTTIQTPLSTTIQPVTSTTTASHQIDSTPTTVDVLSSLGTTTISITSTTTTAPDVPLITKFFLSPSYTGVVYEGKYVVASLIPLKPSTFKSEDIKDKEKVNFEILPFPSNTSIFIRKESGDIMVIGNVDKQTQNNVITFTVRASNNQNKSNFEDALVSLTILKKVNDNSPLFDENTPTAIAVDINTVPLQIIGQFKATDKEDAIITYSITDFGKDLFGIDDEGNVSIKKSLQSADKVNLIQITASDNGSPPLRTTWPVRVEVFDRNTEVTPVFIPQNYSISVPPNNPIDSSLYQMVPGLGTYSFSITSLPKSDLFRVDNTGKIFLNRYPKSDESGKLYIATVKATVPSSGASAVQEIYIQLEKEMDASTALPLLTTTTNTTPTPITTPPPSLQPNCSFDLKVYQNELIENLNVKTKLGTVKTTCQGPTVVPLTFKFVDNDEDLFEIDSDTGDYYAVKGLDFEQKRVHYMTVQFEYKQQLANIRKRQSTNKIIEGYVRNRLKSNQALIVVTVLNANDNPPTFRNLQPTTNNYIFYVDWQAEEKTVIGSVEADDIDENVKVTFALADNQSPIFGIDKNTGSVYLKTSIATSREDMYSLDVNGSDGELVSTAQIIVYKIGPGVNVIALEVNESPQNVDGHLYETQLSKQLDLNVKVIKKQEFVDLNNTAFLNKTLLLVYASDNDMIPVRDDLLKDQITAKMDQLHLGGLEIGAVTTLKSNNLFGLTSWEILLIAICAVLLLLTCFICVCVCYYCKKRKMADKDIKGYMLDSRTEGPRPYNIEVTTRKTAQQILTGPQTQDGNKKYVDVVDTMNGLYGKIDKSNKRGGVDGTDNNQNRNSNQNLNNTLDQKDYTHERDMSYEMYNEPTRTKSSQSDKKLSSSATELKISSHS